MLGNLSCCLKGSDSPSWSCCFHIEILLGKVRSMLVQLPKRFFPWYSSPTQILNSSSSAELKGSCFLALAQGECSAFCFYFQLPNAELAVFLLLWHRLACLDAVTSATSAALFTKRFRFVHQTYSVSFSRKKSFHQNLPYQLQL